MFMSVLFFAAIFLPCALAGNSSSSPPAPPPDPDEEDAPALPDLSHLDLEPFGGPDHMPPSVRSVADALEVSKRKSASISSTQSFIDAGRIVSVTDSRKVAVKKRGKGA